MSEVPLYHDFREVWGVGLGAAKWGGVRVEGLGGRGWV